MIPCWNRQHTSGVLVVLSDCCCCCGGVVVVLLLLLVVVAVGVVVGGVGGWGIDWLIQILIGQVKLGHLYRRISPPPRGSTSRHYKP